MADDLYYRTKCSPEANGRKPQEGESEWALTFPLDDGRSLKLSMGKEAYEKFSQFLLDEMAGTHSYHD